jgi:hypothetical protein
MPDKLTPNRDVGIPLTPVSTERARILAPNVKASEEQFLLVDDEEFSVVSLEITARMTPAPRTVPFEIDAGIHHLSKEVRRIPGRSPT